VEVVFHVGAECRVIRVIRADVAKESCLMDAIFYVLGVESSSETVTIIDTHPDGFSVLIKYTREGSLPKEADLWDTPTNARPYLLSVTDMYLVERMKLHCASKMWDMASNEIVTSLLRWEIQANYTQLQDKCMSLLERIFPHRMFTYDWAVVCTDHPKFMHSLRRRLPEGLYQGPCSFSVFLVFLIM
jgi:hypothetical protein